MLTRSSDGGEEATEERGWSSGRRSQRAQRVNSVNLLTSPTGTGDHDDDDDEDHAGAHEGINGSSTKPREDEDDATSGGCEDTSSFSLLQTLPPRLRAQRERALQEQAEMEARRDASAERSAQDANLRGAPIRLAGRRSRNSASCRQHAPLSMRPTTPAVTA
jgi:hypothetical protein